MIQKLVSVASLLMLIDYGSCSNVTLSDSPKSLHLTESEQKGVMEFTDTKKKSEKAVRYKTKMDRLALER